MIYIYKILVADFSLLQVQPVAGDNPRGIALAEAGPSVLPPPVPPPGEYVPSISHEISASFNTIVAPTAVLPPPLGVPDEVIPPGTISGMVPIVTSTTSATITGGTQTFITETGVNLSGGQTVIIAHDQYNSVVGTVISYNTETGGLVVVVGTTVGEGTHNSWDIYLASGTSTTSLTIAEGIQTLTVEPGLAFYAAQTMFITYNQSNWMGAIVVSYDVVTGELIVDVELVAGSGTYAAWTITLLYAPPPATVDVSSIGDDLVGGSVLYGAVSVLVNIDIVSDEIKQTLELSGVKFS